jgi:predicted acetyltransferase
MERPTPHYVELIRASADQKPILASLMQLYIHDFSEIDGTDVEVSGRYEYPYLDQYWADPSRHPFLIRVDGQWAGFVLVNAESVLKTPDVHCIAEFFVMRKYRKRGVGRHAALAVLSLFPGKWEVAEMTANTAGRDFWRKVIGSLTGGEYLEELVDNDVWEGPVQMFSTTLSDGVTH